MTDAPDAGRRRSKFLVVVDDTPEVKVALRYAVHRARNVNGGVILLRVVTSAGFQQWMAVAELMREEAREAAEKLLQDLATQVQQESGIVPELILREGETRDELLKLIDDDAHIRMLVLAAAPGSGGPGPLVTELAGQKSGNLSVPITVVPGALSDAQIDELT